MKPQVAIALCCMGVSACAAYDTQAAADEAASGAELDSGTWTDLDPRELRIEITPGSQFVNSIQDDGEDDFGPQSFLVPAGEPTGLDLEFQPLVRVGGLVTGFIATPYAADVTLPGESGAPIEARIVARLADWSTGDTTFSDAQGRYEFLVPEGRGYTLSIVPEDPSLLTPFGSFRSLFFGAELVESGQDRAEIDWDLGYGVPVFGTVLLSDGGPYPYSEVFAWLETTDGATVGHPVEVDADGHYMLRARPGEYLLRIGGEEDACVPSFSRDIIVELPPEGGVSEGLREDFDLGLPVSMDLDLRVVGDDGESVAADVRFTGLDLFGSEGVCVLTTDTQSNGKLHHPLLAGEWEVELLLPYDPDGDNSPSRVGFTLDGEEGDELDLGTLRLEPRVSVSRQVLGWDGEPLSNALVTATEVGFSGHSYVATADSQGIVQMWLPDVPLDLVVSPPGTRNAITRDAVGSPLAFPDPIQAVAGTQVDGQVAAWNGTPALFSLVQVHDEASGQVLATTVTDGDGRFAVRVQMGD